MRKKQKRIVAWVLYRMTAHRRGGEAPEANAVCEQAEWDEMERARPSHHALVPAGLVSEAEAERLARSASGGVSPKAI